MISSTFQRKKFLTWQQALSFIWPRSKALISLLIISVLCLVLTILCGLLTPIYLQDFIDKAGTLELIVVSAGLMYAVVWGGKLIAEQLREIVFFPIAEEAACQISVYLFGRILELPYATHTQQLVSRLHTTILRAREGIGYILWGILFFLFPTLIEIIWIVGYLLWKFSYLYVSVFLLTFILATWGTLALVKLSTKYQNKAYDELGILNEFQLDRLSHFLLIKIFGKEKLEKQSYKTLGRKYAHANAKKQVIMESVRLVQAVSYTIGMIMLVYIGSHDIAQHNISLGEFLLIQGYFFHWTSPLSVLGFVIKDIGEGYISLKAASFLLVNDVSPKLPHVNRTQIKSSSTILCFDNVSFSYDNAHTLLQGISLEFEKGEHIGIIGASGEGKSTFVQLMVGLLTPNKGEIFWKGKNLKSTDVQKNMRSALSYAPQQTLLFHASLWENLVYSQIPHDSQEIIDLLESCNLKSFLGRIDYNLQTYIGPGGVEPSLGERQRICLCRALLKKAEIYIFDEIESYLDSHALENVDYLIKSRTKSATVVRISHMPQFLRDMRLLRLQDGKVHTSQ